MHFRNNCPIFTTACNKPAADPLVNNTSKPTIMKQSYSNHIIIAMLETAIKQTDINTFLSFVNKALNDKETDIFTRFFGIGCPRQELEAIAQATGLSLDETEHSFNRALLKIRKHSESPKIFDAVDETAIIKEVEDKFDRYWNTEPGSALYFMHGGFYVNRNPYGPDEEAPSHGIPFDYSNEVGLMDMSDFHSSVVVLGCGEKRGIFPFESAWGMQGFRYASTNSDEPFPYDEVHYFGPNFEPHQEAYFLCRVDDKWGVLRIGDESCPFSIHTIMSFATRSFEETLQTIREHYKISPNWECHKV